MNEEPRRAVAATLAYRLKRMQDEATRRTPVPAAVALQAALRHGSHSGFGHDPRADAALLGMLRLPADDDGRPPPLDRRLAQVLDDAALVATLVASTRVAVHEPTDNDGKPASVGARSLGSDLRAVRSRRSSDAYEGLLNALLRADRSDLPRPLRRALTLMRADGGRLDVFGLVTDLAYWGADSGWVQKRWAYHFWSSAETRPADHTPDDEETA